MGFKARVGPPSVSSLRTMTATLPDDILLNEIVPWAIGRSMHDCHIASLAALCLVNKGWRNHTGLRTTMKRVWLGVLVDHQMNNVRNGPIQYIRQFVEGSGVTAMIHVMESIRRVPHPQIPLPPTLAVHQKSPEEDDVAPHPLEIASGLFVYMWASLVSNGNKQMAEMRTRVVRALVRAVGRDLTPDIIGVDALSTRLKFMPPVHHGDVAIRDNAAKLHRELNRQMATYATPGAEADERSDTDFATIEPTNLFEHLARAAGLGCLSLTPSEFACRVFMLDPEAFWSVFIEPDEGLRHLLPYPV